MISSCGYISTEIMEIALVAVIPLIIVNYNQNKKGTINSTLT